VNCEVIIVGGGVYGCGLANELATDGMDVRVLERDHVAAGSSGGPGARGIRSSGRDLRELPLIRRAHELWPDLADRLAAPTGYHRTGSLRLVEKEAVGTRGGRISLEAHAWSQTRAGNPCVVLDRAKLLELEPDIADAVTHALHCPHDGVADHAQTTRAYADSARRLGAHIHEDEAVTSLVWSGRDVSSVVTTKDVYTPTRAVVLLANTATAQLLADTPVYLPTWRVVPQVVFVRPRHPLSITHLIGHDSRSLSLKPSEDDTVQISGGWRGRWDPATGRGVVDPEMVDASLEQSSQVYPALHGAAVVDTDAARPESCSSDGIPLIDSLPDSTNTYIATGWSAHGFALAPAVCELLAHWIISGNKPEILAPFGIDRFTHTRGTATASPVQPL
jgi:sarcosine oxidase, subunit beta